MSAALFRTHRVLWMPLGWGWRIAQAGVVGILSSNATHIAAAARMIAHTSPQNR